MPSEVAPAYSESGGADDVGLVAAAVRAGIDALLTARAPAERDAFWHAVALLYARGFTSERQPGPAPIGEDGAKLDTVPDGEPDRLQAAPAYVHPGSTPTERARTRRRGGCPGPRRERPRYPDPEIVPKEIDHGS